MGKLKIILDTDPGNDDLMAIIMALKSDDIDVRGLTIVGGNASVQNTTNNALSLLTYLDRIETPVYVGNASALNEISTSSEEFDEFKKLIPQTIFVSATPAEYEKRYSGQIVEQVVRPTGLIDPEIKVFPASTQVDNLMSEANIRTKRGERVLVTTLTKRMAESLTEYYSDHGMKVRYLHSDIGTVERVEIIRDLRLGKFNILVGINLLREGLDIPEVSLVAILDADKEGFLRSERSLIQTIGRAARHINGTAILYGDKITNSMQRAIEETNRRRNIQIEFNKLNNITPQSINKRIKDLIDGVYDLESEKQNLKSQKTDARYEMMSEKQITLEIKRQEKKMLKAAKNMEFELAAKYRDELKKLKQILFVGSANA